MRLIVAVTGASGAELGYQVLKALRIQGVEIRLILSEGAKRVIREETHLTEAGFLALADKYYSDADLGARIASGGFATDGMIVVPCSMKTLSGIANAYDETLTVRAADVCLKERRKVVLVPRETPLNQAHLRNLLAAAGDGCVIIPPMFTFYAGADTLEQQMHQITGKILAQFGLRHPEFVPWKEA